MKPRVYIVTRNQGKLTEIRDILEAFGIEARSIYEITDIGEVAETGKTYLDNALLKARAGFAKTGLLSIGEDSGLEVDALGGLPGIHSARFGGPELSQKERINLLLEHLRGVPQEKRTARFVCVVALASPWGEKVFEGICEGYIAEEPQGELGFGYDPVFVFPPFEKTFAQLGPEVKNRVSHRAMALRKLAQFLREKIYQDLEKNAIPGGLE